MRPINHPPITQFLAGILLALAPFGVSANPQNELAQGLCNPPLLRQASTQATTQPFLPLAASALEPDHPAVQALLKEAPALFTESSDHHEWERSEAATLLRLGKLNEALGLTTRGAFHFYPFNGELHFFYLEEGRTYFIPSRSPKGEPTFSEHLPSFLTELKPGERLAERFKRPAGYEVVGYERSFNGLIVPIVSPSAKLSEFRDYTNYKDELSKEHIREGTKARLAIQVPLVKIRYLRKVETKGKSQNRSDTDPLPTEIRDLLNDGFTLSSAASAEALDPSYQVFEKNPSATAYSALLIGSETGQGRSGVLQKNGLPIISIQDGVEWVTELKGMGFGKRTENKTVHGRGSHSIRIGRADLEQVTTELESYALLRQAELIENDNLTPTAVAGVVLPEFSGKEEVFRPIHEKVNYQASMISAQVFRVVSSTRRLAYTLNPAFDLPYADSERTLNTTQTYLGKMFASLRLGPPDLAFEPVNPHAQNFILTPGSLSLRLTDYSDVFKIESAETYLTLEFPTAREYHAFDTQASRSRFLGGIKSVLEPRSLWNDRLESLFYASSETVIATQLEEEVLFPLFIDHRSLKDVQKYLIPKLTIDTTSLEKAESESETRTHAPWTFVVQHYESLTEQLTQLELAFRRLALSNGVAGRLPLLSKQSIQASRQLGELIRAVESKRSEINEQTRSRTTSLDGDFLETYRILTKVALILDSASMSVDVLDEDDSESTKLAHSMLWIRAEEYLARQGRRY